MRSSKWLSMLAVAAMIAAACDGLVDHAGPTGVRRIGRDGGTVSSPLGVSLIIPPNALEHDELISIDSSSAASTSGAVRAIEIRPFELQLSTGARLRYDVPDAAFGSPKAKIAALEFAAWTVLPDPAYELDAHAISADVTHLGTFALVPVQEQCDNGLDDDLDGRIDCADPACLLDPVCRSCGLTACGATTACCPYQQTCFDPACPNCCGAGTGADAGSPTDGGVGSVCGSSLCVAGQACARGTCVWPSDAGTDGGYFEPDGGYGDGGFDDGGLADAGA